MIKRYNNFINEALTEHETLYELWKDIEKPIFDELSKPEIGDVVYYKPKKAEYSKEAKFIKIRDDGKYVIKFRDNKLMAVSKKNIIKDPKVDPYSEEEWDDNNPWAKFKDFDD